MSEKVADRQTAGEPCCDPSAENPLFEQCCEPIASGPLCDDCSEELARRLKALAEPSRLRILSMIAAQPSGEMCICDLEGPLGLTQGTVSHHVKVLFDAGLVWRQKRGTHVWLGMVPGALSALATIISD
jgi:ArsR family transcriptional regulator